MVMAKGLASGFPLSAIVSRKELTDMQPAGAMGGTYVGIESYFDVTFKRAYRIDSILSSNASAFIRFKPLCAYPPVKSGFNHCLNSLRHSTTRLLHPNFRPPAN
eukprot:CFRG7441T1